jgi:hypothetical protein
MPHSGPDGGRYDASMRVPPTARWGRPVILGFAVIGLLVGIDTLLSHLATDPFADVHAYYEAGARLNAGLPLYEQPAGTDEPDFYRYPPLLAIAFRPLALLPFETAALIWQALLVTAFAWSIWRLGLRRADTWLAVGILALPTAWSIAVGQAHVLVTALLVSASPFGVALAAHIKLFPILVGVYWVGRRDWRALGWLVGWVVGLGVLQLALEPAATIAFLRFPSLDQVGEVRNISPFAISPYLWVLLLAAGGLLAVRLAPTRWGWAAAVVLATLATPRLILYQLSSLLAALSRPREEEVDDAVASEPGPGS